MLPLRHIFVIRANANTNRAVRPLICPELEALISVDCPLLDTGNIGNAVPFNRGCARWNRLHRTSITATAANITKFRHPKINRFIRSQGQIGENLGDSHPRPKFFCDE